MRGLNFILAMLVYLLAEAFGLPRHWALAGDSEYLARREDLDFAAMIERDFIRHDPEYLATRADYAKRVEPLEARLVALQKQGAHMACSEQIFIETEWLLEGTTDWSRLDARIARLAESLLNTDQDFATRQSPHDGSWGPCYESWFMKLDAAIPELISLAEEGKTLRYPLKFLRRINSADTLIPYLQRLLISDIARTGVDHRDELGAVTGALSQMLFKPWLRRFLSEQAEDLVVTDAFVDAYRNFLDASQDPSTGYWGAWYRFNGKLYKSADLSLTFHSISYRKGEVRYWPRIITTLFATENRQYPYGWMHNNGYNHHNNYDVAKIIRYGWPYMTDTQKNKARSVITAMLKWCTGAPLQSSELFPIDATFYSSLSNYYYYGVAFLAEIGYWDKSRRFWTDREFPRAAATCRTIKTRLAALQFNTEPSSAAMQILDAGCPTD